MNDVITSAKCTLTIRFTKNIYLKVVFLIADNVRHVDAVLGNKAELPCDIQSEKNSTEWPILIIWYRGHDHPIYR